MRLRDNINVVYGVPGMEAGIQMTGKYAPRHIIVLAGLFCALAGQGHAQEVPAPPAIILT